MNRNWKLLTTELIAQELSVYYRKILGSGNFLQLSDNEEIKLSRANDNLAGNVEIALFLVFFYLKNKKKTRERLQTELTELNHVMIDKTRFILW